MYDRYLTICSFVRFSGIDPDYIPLTKQEISNIMKKKEPIIISIGEYKIFIFHKRSNKYSHEQLHKLGEESKCIFIKSKWKKDHPKNATYLLDEHFECDIAPINLKYQHKRITANDPNFDFHKLDPINFPKIIQGSILAIWMLLEEDDVLSTTMISENGKDPTYRFCVKSE